MKIHKDKITIRSLKLAFIVVMLLTSFSCQKEYMEEPTEEGVNNHSFIMNGEKWARQGYTYTPGRLPPATFDESINLLKLRLYSYNTPDDDKKSKLDMDVFLNKEDIITPYSISLQSYDLSGPIDTTKNYLRFRYVSDEKPTWTRYDEVLSANLTITRFDTIVAGTFKAVVSDGTDTFKISDGKFDYQCKFSPY